ncbi:MAG: glycosyltransferase family 2 protein [Planctomycetota bacterium]|nr:MAG: glycosyltransferase family 2 protein [Planctomycetota bacterium]REJ89568.1 MAG: glycosyltransferase family 2 protein [Planctomycetota bacterium]REK31431.1 MAG: glycosyltransferase family 2 protein [Planctomycetota bacterium]REK40661.1 MAG: glycosyltransferase family 2 protein [Planctomycetota bacterium]
MTVGDESPEAVPQFSVVVPCYNERDGVGDTIAAIVKDLEAGPRYEVIIVNDGSNDGTAEILEELAPQYAQVRVETHPQNRGYGAALKTGIRRAASDLIVITDADGTYPNERIPDLVALAHDADMVVGARTADNVEYSKIRKIPKIFLAAYASWIAQQKIPDINSGLRVMRRSVLEKFLPILPDSFSFTTTITLAMLTNAYHVKFEPIGYTHRVGKSKIRPIRDTLLFFQLILRTGMYFAPLRVFFPVGLLLGIAFLVSLVWDVFVVRNLGDRTILFLLFGMSTVMFALLADMIDKRSAR